MWYSSLFVLENLLRKLHNKTLDDKDFSLNSYCVTKTVLSVYRSSHIMAMYKKLQVQKLSTNFGDAVKVMNLPLRPAAEGEVRVKNHFAGVNAGDIMHSSPSFCMKEIPFDIGLEGCGLVDDVGVGVESFSVGQPVLYMGWSGYSEYIYAKPEELTPLPTLKPQFLGAAITGKITR